LQFYLDKLEKALLLLEHDYRDRAAKAIAKTRFGIRNTDDGFERVEDGAQAERTGRNGH
jgi:hypothetical protein